MHEAASPRKSEGDSRANAVELVSQLTRLVTEPLIVAAVAKIPQRGSPGRLSAATDVLNLVQKTAKGAPYNIELGDKARVALRLFEQDIAGGESTIAR